MASPDTAPASTARATRRRTFVLVAIMWAAALTVLFLGARDRGITAPLRATDFVHFYTLGHLAREHRVSTMYEMRALHEAQVALVPESANDVYPAVYPPQIPVLFAPVSGWSYQHALFVWNVLTVVAYGLIVWSAWSSVRDRISNRAMLIAAAAAFPPFLSLVLYGQITVIIVAAFWAGWLALERRQHLLAGVALGLLAIKPQFGIPLAVIVLARREWAMLAGALISVLLQAGVAWAVLGLDAFRGFAHTLPITFSSVDAFESKPFLSHSLRALTRLAPNWLGVPLWMALAAIVLWLTVRVWRSDAPIRVRLGTVILASVLVNPHVIAYDATVLALPLIWFAAFMQEPSRRERVSQFWKVVCWLFVTLFIPTAAVIGVQASVLVMVWLLVLVSLEVQKESAVDLPYNAQAA